MSLINPKLSLQQSEWPNEPTLQINPLKEHPPKHISTTNNDQIQQNSNKKRKELLQNIWL